MIKSFRLSEIRSSSLILCIHVSLLYCNFFFFSHELLNYWFQRREKLKRKKASDRNTPPITNLQSHWLGQKQIQGSRWISWKKLFSDARDIKAPESNRCTETFTVQVPQDCLIDGNIFYFCNSSLNTKDMEASVPFLFHSLKVSCARHCASLDLKTQWVGQWDQAF